MIIRLTCTELGRIVLSRQLFVDPHSLGVLGQLPRHFSFILLEQSLNVWVVAL